MKPRTAAFTGLFLLLAAVVSGLIFVLTLPHPDKASVNLWLILTFAAAFFGFLLLFLASTTHDP